MNLRLSCKSGISGLDLHPRGSQGPCKPPVGLIKDSRVPVGLLPTRFISAFNDARNKLWICVQVLATTAKNMILLDLGMTVAFPTIVIPALSNTLDPLALNSEQTSWFGKWTAFGNLFLRLCTRARLSEEQARRYRKMGEMGNGWWRLIESRSRWRMSKKIGQWLERKARTFIMSFLYIIWSLAKCYKTKKWEWDSDCWRRFNNYQLLGNFR